MTVPSALTAAALALAAPPEVLSPLTPGMSVGLKDEPGGSVVTLIPGVSLGYTVAEVGPGHLVVMDITGTAETRIPLTSIKAVRVVRVPGAGMTANHAFIPTSGS